jgi:hypothetical protein
MHRHEMKVVERKPPPRQVFLGRPRYRMNAADGFIARDPEVLEWLARVHAEKRHGSRAWPQFEAQGLEAFLRAAQVDVDRAVKEHTDALAVMPAKVTDPETCIPCLRGASFVYPSAEAACLGLERTARTRRQPAHD